MIASPPAGLRPLVLLALAWLGQAEAAAGEPAFPTAWQTAPPGEETSPRPKLPAKIREAVARSLPSYTPPKPEPTPILTPTPDDDLLVLPTIKVKPDEAPTDSFAFLSHKARAELARKQNPGLGLSPLSRLNEDLGVELLTEEREYAKRSALHDEITPLSRLDPTGFAQAVKLLRDATAQPNRDWATSVGGNRNPSAVTIRPPPYPPKKRR